MPLVNIVTGVQVSNTKTANYNPTNFQWLCDGGTIVQDTNPQALKFVLPAPTVSVTTFKLLVGSALPGILAAKATDTTLQALFYIIDDPRTTQIDLSLASVQANLNYLVTKNLLTTAQLAVINSGIAQ